MDEYTPYVQFFGIVRNPEQIASPPPPSKIGTEEGVAENFGFCFVRCRYLDWKL